MVFFQHWKYMSDGAKYQLEPKGFGTLKLWGWTGTKAFI
jgi:hypothetical protein